MREVSTVEEMIEFTKQDFIEFQRRRRDAGLPPVSAAVEIKCVIGVDQLPKSAAVPTVNRGVRSTNVHGEPAGTVAGVGGGRYFVA